MMDRSLQDPLLILKPLFAGSELPALGPASRVSRMPLAELNRQLDDALKRANLPATAQALVRSAALLWHDHLDESHTLSQSIESPDGSFLHGIMHRREPDYANAKYWFRRVGTHPCFSEIGRLGGGLLDSIGQGNLKRLLLPNDRWDPFAFVDSVERAASNRSLADCDLSLRQLQQVEFEVLFEHFCRLH